MKERIVPKKVWRPVGAYSHVIKVTRPRSVIFVAGQIPVNSDGKIVGVEEAGDANNNINVNLELQIRQTFQNIKNCLSDADAKLSDIVRLNTFVVSTAFNEYRKIGSRIRREILGDYVPPGATVAVVSLMPPQALIEIEAIAVVD